VGRRCQNENGGGVKCSSGRVKVVGQKEEAEDTPIQKQQPKASKDGEHTCKKPLLHPSNRPPIPSLLVYYHAAPARTNGKDADGAHHTRHGSNDQLGRERDLLGGWRGRRSSVSTGQATRRRSGKHNTPASASLRLEISLTLGTGFLISMAISSVPGTATTADMMMMM